MSNKEQNDKKLFFLVGPHSGGKTTYIYKKMYEAITDSDGNIDLNKKAYLVVPEQDTKEKQKGFMEYKDNKSKGMLNCDVISFDRICHMVFSKLMIDDIYNMNIIQDDMKALFCQIAVERRANELPLYKRKARKIGFSEKLASAISEFATYKIDREEINKVLTNDKVEKAIKDELAELLVVQDEFNRLLESTNLNIVENKMKILSENIDKVDIFDNATIFFDGFTGFSPVQKEVFERIKNKANKVYVAIDYREEEFNDYISNKYDKNKTNEKYENNIFHISDIFMESICDKDDIKDSCIFLKDGLDIKYKNSKDLLHIEENIFNDKNIKEFDGNASSVSVIHNKDISSELEYVINKIIELTRINDNPISYNDIKIIVPNLENYKDTIITKFNKYNIPLFIDDSQSIFYSPYIKAIRAFIDLCEKDYSYDSLMGYMNSGLFDKDGIFSQDEDKQLLPDRSIYYFDNALRMFGVKNYNALSTKRAMYRNIYRYMMKNEKLFAGSQKQYMTDDEYTELLSNIELTDQARLKDANKKTRAINPNIKNVVEEHAGEIYKVYNTKLSTIMNLYEKHIRKNKNKQFSICEFVAFIREFIDKTDLDNIFTKYVDALNESAFSNSRCEVHEPEDVSAKFTSPHINMDSIKTKDLAMLIGSKDKIQNILDLLDQIGKTNTIDNKELKYSLQELSLIMDSAIDIFKVKSIPFSMDQIVVGDLMRSRFDNPKVLFFLGMNDSALSQKRNDDNIINDKMREAFSSSDIQLSQSLVETTYNSRFYTYLALSNPSEQLYLSYTSMNADGESDYKSRFLIDVEELFNDIALEVQNNTDDLAIYDTKQMREYIALHNAENTRVINKIDSYIDEYETLGSYKKAMVKNAIVSKQYFDILKNVEKDKENLNKDKKSYKNIAVRHTNISKEVVDELYKDGFVSSATGMEKYANCPYKYFLENTIGITEREDNEIDSRNIGNIFHNTLEQFFENGKHFTNVVGDDGKEKINKIDLNDEKLKKEIYDLAEEAIRYEFETQAKENDSMSQQFMIERLKEIMYVSIKYMLEQMKTQSPVVRVYHELPFDDYILDDTNNSRLRGRIDQVELIKPFEDKSKYKSADGTDSASLNDDNVLYIKIIDYKSSNKDIDKKKIAEGQMIQFIVYLDYIREALQKKVFVDNVKKYFNKNDKVLVKYDKFELLGTFYKSILDNVVRIDKDDFDKYKKKVEKSTGQSFDYADLFKQYVDAQRNENMKMTGIVNVSDNKMKLLDYDAKVSRYDTRVSYDKTNINSLSPNGVISLEYDNEFDSLINDVKTKLTEKINDIREGKFPVIAHNDACQYCSFAGSCGIEKFGTEEGDGNE